MKKTNFYLKFATILLAFVLLSCSDDFYSSENMDTTVSTLATPQTNAVVSPNDDMPGFYNASVTRSIQNFDRYIGTYGGHSVYFNFEKSMRDEAKELAPYFGVPQNFDYSTLLHNLTIPNPSPGAKVLPSQVQGVTSTFSPTQLYYLDKYFGTMYDAGSAFQAEVKFNKVIYEMEQAAYVLEVEESIQIKSIMEIGNQFAKEYFANRVVPIIEGDIYDTFGRGATGSCVNFKTAWQSAVLSGFAGGIYGGIYGGLGGTVFLPGFGTVTGAVGGAVFGFAYGFVGGALSSIAQDAIFKCLLGSSYQETNEQCEDFDFFAAHPEWCNEYYGDRLYFYSL